MQVLSNLPALAVAASVLAGASISFIIKISDGPYNRGPLGLAVAISAGSGATITTVAHVLNDSCRGSIWPVMLIGAAGAILGAWGHMLIASRSNHSGPSRRNPSRKTRSARANHYASGDVFSRGDRQKILIAPISRQRKSFPLSDGFCDMNENAGMRNPISNS